MANAYQFKTEAAKAFENERDLQRIGTRSPVDGRAVADALGMAVKRACCLESLAAVLVEETDKTSAAYRLAELLALDVSALAVELEAIRDDLERAV